MAEVLTSQQKEAVTNRGGNLLVSAAAGSGKTKVLVDRLLSYLTDPVKPANIDDFLIITYTKAAAAELRGKIAAKLSDALLQDPENMHMQSQIQRLHLTKISTVHAFCSELLREYAFRLDIPADFRVLEENEAFEMQISAIEKVLDAAYANGDADFYALVDTQGLGRDDRQIPDIILQVYDSARCHLNMDKWLDWCQSVNDLPDFTDVSETVWGRYLIQDLHAYLDLHIAALSECAELASAAEHMEKPACLLREIIAQLQTLRGCTLWDAHIAHMNIDFGRLVFSKKCDNTILIDRIKAVRDACKTGVAKKLKRFSEDSKTILRDLVDTGAAARGIVKLVRSFMQEYAAAKYRRRVVDFADLEHLTLDLLIGKSRSGPTATAHEIGERFREVMVDEYQDSNAVQDAIFAALTCKNHNCFMVGDVKQSIYQFRLADPGIFLEKYNSYTPAEVAKHGCGRKVLLSSNFRSSSGVIDAVNDVFHHCMSKQVGGLDYGPDEELNEGIPHCKLDEPEIELHGIITQDNAYQEEASFTAERITQLLDGNHYVRNGDALRPVCADDIVILLRSPSSLGGAFVTELEKRGIRCSFGNSTNILQTEEIQTMRAILQVIDNPLQDIPLVATLSSRVFGFTANDLAVLRSERRSGSIYHSVCSSSLKKAENFRKILKVLRNEAKMNSLTGLLQSVFVVTGIDSIFSAMPDGHIRMENLQNFCMLASNFDSGNTKSLSRFLRHLNAMDDKGVPSPGEQSTQNAVTIMSIHKSKGLEFPVVFLCGLARGFNRSSAQQQVICDKDLGLGLNCVDIKNRVRYPSVAKRAIAVKILKESVSEELRILYVAMTRARDRLIMTYAASDLEKTLFNMVQRTGISSNRLLTGDAMCPGEWVLLSALQRSEAGAFYKVAGYPEHTRNSEHPWWITLGTVDDSAPILHNTVIKKSSGVNEVIVARLKRSLSFEYPYLDATRIPSKQTATQLKGRNKDEEVSQNADMPRKGFRMWRSPEFVSHTVTGADFGTAMHIAMQYICYDNCSTESGVNAEIQRLQKEGYLTKQQASIVDHKAIATFFMSPVGKWILGMKNVLREFKFSILEDARIYDANVTGELILLQGVVDCAVVEPDGITIVDFKSDRVNSETIGSFVEKYRPQVEAYASALSKIYQLPVKTKILYFFSLGQMVNL